ncbi:histidine kinase [uncultured Amnibacterium sp.]|uniref:sensor histidine kinase n=1 Tax=uncultured Amnibacterium sp. TaxID=1631851 RepID=UPI0035CA5102
MTAKSSLGTAVDPSEPESRPDSSASESSSESSSEPWAESLPGFRRRRTPAWAIDLLIAVVVVGSGFAPIGGPGVVELQPPDLRAIPVLLLGALVLPARRRWPVCALIATVVIACAAALAGLSTPAFVIPVAVSVYAVTLSRPRRVALPLLIGSAVLLPLANLATAVPSAFSPSAFAPAAFLSARAVQLIAIVAAAAGIGAAARARRATIAAITGRAQRAEQTRESEARRRVAEDRLAIARDLHDLVAHQIAVINLQAGVASRGLRDRPDEAEQALAAIREAARSVITEIGDLLALLRATGGAATSLAPQVGLGRLDALVALFEQSGLRVQLAVDPAATRVTDAVGVVAYQVIQEGLTNAHKHGADHAIRLTVTLSADALSARSAHEQTLVITMENDAAERARRVRPGNGLTGMRERVVAAGGEMRAEQDARGRFRLTVTLPLAPADSAPDDSAPVDSAPPQGVPVGGRPAACMPTDATPVEAAPVHAALTSPAPTNPVPANPVRTQ